MKVKTWKQRKKIEERKKWWKEEWEVNKGKSESQKDEIRKRNWRKIKRGMKRNDKKSKRWKRWKLEEKWKEKWKEMKKWKGKRWN